MNKVELTRVVAEKTELTLKDATEVVDAVLGTVVDALAHGEEVSIAGFGKFVVKRRAARESINPRTKEVVKVPASKAPVFKAGKALKEVVNK